MKFNGVDFDTYLKDYSISHYQLDIKNLKDLDMIIDDLTNKPITIVDFNSLKNLLSDISITDILLNRTDKINSYIIEK